MPVDIEPPELAALVDFAERPRIGDWSLRSALVRYAQPEPERSSRILDLVRRIEWALQPHLKLLGTDGPALWAALSAGTTPSGPAGFVVELLAAMRELDAVGDVLARWADDRSTPRPDDDVDRLVADVATRVERLAIPPQERVRPPRSG